ncbi:MAG: coproporphyrinogen III oxidase, partial [Bacteroidales bacterium]|nr:coproporphyrinogen III oxidase [Bacteroidales bacterium]
DEMADQFGITEDALRSTLQFSPGKLSEFINDGLVSLDDKGISVSQQGMLIVRNIAMAFDPQLEVRQGMYSKTI